MSACRHIRCPSEADAYAWDGVRWARLCGDHLAGLARVVDLGVYTVAWDVDVDGPPPPTAGPTRKIPTPPEVSDAPLTDATTGATTPAAPVADTDTDTAPEPLCTSSTSSSTSSAPAPSGSDAGASPGPAVESSPSPSADPLPKRKPGGSKPKFPTVTRRIDPAPGLCLNSGCTSPRKSRGMCHRCFERADRQGVLHRLSVELGRMVDHIQDAHDALGAAGVPNEGTPSARIRALALRAESADIELDLHQLRLALGVDARCSDVATIGAACRMLRGLRSVRYLLGALDAAGPESARHIIAAMTAEVGE